MNEFIDELKKYLLPLSEEERFDVIEFYSEYLSDSGIETYKEAVSTLGTPKQLSRKILADYSIKASEQPVPEENRSKSKRDINIIWLIILAIFSTPITIPFALVIIALMFAVVISIGAVIMAFVLSLVIIFFVALFLVFLGLTLLSSAIWTGIYYIGLGLMIIGVYIIILPAAKWLIENGIHWTSIFFKWLYGKVVTQNKAEEKRGDEK